MRRLVFYSEVRREMRLRSRYASDYSGTFRDKERFEEERWIKKHEIKVASEAERRKEMKVMPQHHTTSRQVRSSRPRYFDAFTSEQ